MSCLSQITLDWQHFAQVQKASQMKCSKLFYSCSTPRYLPNAQDSALHFTKMLCPPHNKDWSYNNTSAAVIVGT